MLLVLCILYKKHNLKSGVCTPRFCFAAILYGFAILPLKFHTLLTVESLFLLYFCYKYAIMQV